MEAGALVLRVGDLGHLVDGAVVVECRDEVQEARLVELLVEHAAVVVVVHPAVGAVDVEGAGPVIC